MPAIGLIPLSLGARTAREAGRAHPGSAIQGVHFQPRVIGQDLESRLTERGCRERFLLCILPEGQAVLLHRRQDDARFQGREDLDGKIFKKTL